MSPRPTPIAERLQRVIRTVHRIIGAPDYLNILQVLDIPDALQLARARGVEIDTD